MRPVLGLGVMLLCPFAFGESGQDLHTIKTVYMLPMGNGLDQYLADRIARAGLYTVVTDPERADAIFTDRIGTGFEDALKNLYSAQDTEQDKFGTPPERARVGSSRARGTVFLVDRTTRAVMWSTFVPVSGSHPADVEKRARHIVDALGKYLKHLEKQATAPAGT